MTRIEKRKRYSARVSHVAARAIAVALQEATGRNWLCNSHNASAKMDNSYALIAPIPHYIEN